MIDHVIDLSETAARLSVRNGLLVIDRRDEGTHTVPLADVAALIMANPQVTCSVSVLAGLSAAGGAVIACDAQHLPVGLMLPIQSHSTQTERFSAQAAAPLPLRKRLWKQIVREKIRAQARLLMALRGEDAGLGQMISRVRSGDPQNLEAQAARRYWPLLFKDDRFQRRRDADDQNRLLNYGYAVLRAVVGRAICGAGLHPSLGLHHHNRYNAFCLADDLMEPYRPIVDSAVVEHVEAYGRDAPLDRVGKTAILSAILARRRCKGEVRTLFDWVARTASSLTRTFLGEADRLFFPKALDDAGE